MGDARVQLAGQRTLERTTVLALAALVATAMAGLLVGREGILIPLLAIGPLIAATYASAIQVLAIAVLAIAIGSGLGAADDTFGNTDHIIELLGVAVGGILAVWIAHNRSLLAGEGLVRDHELATERSARRRADVLARAGELIGAQIDIAQTLGKITELAVPGLADLAVVDVLENDGSLRGAAAHASEPGLASEVLATRRSAPVDLGTAHPTARAVVTGAEQLVRELPEARMREISLGDEHLELMRRARYNSGIALPLRGRDGTLGALSLLRLGPSAAFTEDDLSIARDLAARAALALDSARLVAELRTSEQRFQAILDNMGEAVSAFAPDGSFAFANRAAAELIGAASPEEFMSRPIDEIAGDYNMFDEAGNELSVEALPFARALLGEHPAPKLLHLVERASGRELWLLNRCQPVLGGDGSVSLAVSVSEDVTAMKREELRQRFLAHAGARLGESLELAETLRRIAWVAVPYLADWTRVDLLDEHGDLTEVGLAAAENSKIELLRAARAEGPPTREEKRGPYEAMRTGRTVIWPNVSDEDVEAFARTPHQAELMHRIATRSVLVVPLMADGKPIGAMQIATTDDSGRRLGDTDVQLAEELARRAAMAIENAKLHEQRSYIAATLQRSLLPPQLPAVSGLDLGVRFRPAGAASDVGGDFYDVFAAGDSWVVVIGDVTGKGPDAAAITALARHTVRTASHYERDPGAVLARLDDALRADGGDRGLCTAICARLHCSRDATEVVIACGGHPAAYIVRAGGALEPAPAKGMMLGAFEPEGWACETLTLNEGDALVLYTDGVLDARGSEGRFGAARLEQTLAASAGAPAQEIADRVDEALLSFQDGDQRDDVALLVVRVSSA